MPTHVCAGHHLHPRRDRRENVQPDVLHAVSEVVASNAAQRAGRCIGTARRRSPLADCCVLPSALHWFGNRAGNNRLPPSLLVRKQEHPTSLGGMPIAARKAPPLPTGGVFRCLVRLSREIASLLQPALTLSTSSITATTNCGGAGLSFVALPSCVSAIVCSVMSPLRSPISGGVWPAGVAVSAA